MPQSWWQIKCGFVQQPTKASPPNPVPATEETKVPPPMPDSEGAQPTTANDPPIVPETDAEEGAEPELELPSLRRSKHLHWPVDWLTCAMTAELAHASQDCEGELLSLEALLLPLDSHADAVAFAASKDPDIMYLYQAMKEPDKDQFLAAMEEEMGAQLKGKNFLLILRPKVPKGATILPAVWQMMCKHCIQTHKVYKWKACLNIDRSRQIKGQDYWDTYALVATQGSIHLILAKAIIQGWYSKQIDFVMAYTQAPVERDMSMEVPSKGL